ncbi:hypothetical protein BT67DRAFT_21375 [Trichocladium antarcticum]|uniref:Uncharacterized protein n=1 Tax=Trichocladium antarcticum TaxID=1450529 RepID=A0AAN6UTH0_9PEZI|nr:hypothetical protein BT67DRAFT_21375 [Trichocladium antarcticum]
MNWTVWICDAPDWTRSGCVFHEYPRPGLSMQLASPRGLIRSSGIEPRVVEWPTAMLAVKLPIIACRIAQRRGLLGPRTRWLQTVSILPAPVMWFQASGLRLLCACHLPTTVPNPYTSSSSPAANTRASLCLPLLPLSHQRPLSIRLVGRPVCAELDLPFAIPHSTVPVARKVPIKALDRSSVATRLEGFSRRLTAARAPLPVRGSFPRR